MESQRFDRLVQNAATTRRGAVRTGIGALAAATLATFGLAATDADARRRRRRKTICFQGNTLQVRRPRRYLRQGATRGACLTPETCPTNRPVTCGNGCCPSTYSLCCETTGSPTETHSCNPPDATCCPASAGGGSCPMSILGVVFAPADTVCCPPTKFTPRGWCAEPGGDCCSTAEGGFACPPGGECCPIPEQGCGCEGFGPWCAFAEQDEVCCSVESGGGNCFVDFPVCCPDTCCPAGSTCCENDDDCAEGTDCFGGCCEATGMEKPDFPGGPNRGRHSGEERFHMPAS